MKKILTLILCICFIFIISGLLPIHNEAKIYDSVLRLHVVANSNSKEDQALKLKVRDKILELGEELFADCGTLAHTQAVIEDNLDRIQTYAEEQIHSLGYSYPVKVRLSNEEYPSKQYGSLCFPSGEYSSLQILIGDAVGDNWWCVLFPPLCLGAATATTTNEDAFIQVGLNAEQYEIITETKKGAYEARFRILEALEEIF